MSENMGKVLRKKRVYEGRVINVDLETVRLPNGAETDLEVIRHPGASAVVPLLSGEESQDPGLLLIHQYRYAAQGKIWEIPAGVLEEGETPLECARRELKEETGATAGKIEFLATVYTTPGFTDEQIHLFVASDIEGGSANTAADEDIETVVRPMSEVLEMIRDGEIRDAKTIAAILFVAGYRLRF